MKNVKLAAIAVGVALALSASLASAQNVYVGSNWNTAHVSSVFPGAPTVVLYLPVCPNTCSYIVNAKASLRNDDGDAQSADCRLWLVPNLDPTKARVLDLTQVRIPAAGGGDKYSVALQAAFTTPPGDNLLPVELSCVTYNGAMSDSVITAVRVSNIYNPGPSYYTQPPQ